jgi:maleylacetate reductase
VLSTPDRAEAQASGIAASLGAQSAGIFTGAVMHTPLKVTERALEVVRGRGADAVVAIGGGSTTPHEASTTSRASSD